MKLLNGRIGSLILRSCTLGSRLGLTVLLAAALTPAEAGKYGLYASALMLSGTLIGLDVYTIASRTVLALPDQVAPVVARHIGFMTLATAVLVPLSIVFYAWQARPALVFVIVFALHLCFEFVSQEAGRFLVVLRRPLMSDALLLVRTGAWIPLAACIINVFPGLDRLAVIICCWLTASLITALASALTVGRMLGMSVLVPAFDLQWIFSNLRSCVCLFVGSLLFRLVLGADRYFVNAFIGLEAVGIYTVQVSMAIAVLGLLESSVSSWRYPPLVTALQQRNKEETWRQMQIFFRESLGVVFLLTLASLLVVPTFLRLCTNPAYSSDMTAFYWMLAGVAFYSVSLPMHYVLYGLRWDRQVMMAHAAGGVTLSTVAAALMTQWGLAGAGAALAAALGSIALLRFTLGWFSLKREGLGSPSLYRFWITQRGKP